MKRILFVAFASITITLCACSPPAPEVAKANSSPSAAPSAAFDAAAAEKAVIELEKKSWENYRTRNAEESKKLTLPGYISLDSGKIHSLEESLSNMKDWDIKSVSFSDWKVFFPIKDTAIVTYKVTAPATFKGKDASATDVPAAAIWVNVGGEWKAAMYAETRAMPSTSPMPAATTKK